MHRPRTPHGEISSKLASTELSRRSALTAGPESRLAGNSLPVPLSNTSVCTHPGESFRWMSSGPPAVQRGEPRRVEDPDGHPRERQFEPRFHLAVNVPPLWSQPRRPAFPYPVQDPERQKPLHTLGGHPSPR